MCNKIVSYFKRNQKVQRNKIQSRSEQDNPIISQQVDKSMSGAIRVEHIRDGKSRSEQTELMGIIRLEQSGVKASGEKSGRSEWSKKITQREKIHDKRGKKSVVIISERRVRKVVWIRTEQEVYYRMTQSEENIRYEKVDKQRRRSTQGYGR